VRPTLVVSPPSDGKFAELASALLDDASTPASLEAALRRTYPRCVVRPREISAERYVVWYVYRDGHWVPSEYEGS
jgi:hypothetical protein